MAKKGSGQKFIGRNRAPRVHIEYAEPESEEVLSLPFIMGVMADLSGKPAEALPAVGDRQFKEVDVDNFDDYLKSQKPRVAMQVPNTLTGDGKLSVDITFESLDDFSPGAVARKVEPLRKLLEARTQLDNLLTWMDGKGAAEDKLSEILSDPSVMQALASARAPEGSADNEQEDQSNG